MLGGNDNKFKDDIQPDMTLHLEEDENIIWQCKPDKSAMKKSLIFRGLPFVLLWIAFDALMLYFIISGFISRFVSGNSGIDITLIFFVLGFFIVHMLPVWMWLRNIFTINKKYNNSSYVLSDKRVIIKDATAKYKFREVYLEDIKEVKASAGRKGVGTVFIYANTQAYIMPYLIDAELVKEKITQHISLTAKELDDELEEEEEGGSTLEGYTPPDNERGYNNSPNLGIYPVREEQSEEEKLKEQFEELFSDDEED